MGIQRQEVCINRTCLCVKLRGGRAVMVGFNCQCDIN